MNLYDVIRRPLVTEKNTNLQTLGKYAFEVSSSANKMQVKQAVEKAFKVKVKAVNIMNISGKRRMLGRRQIVTPSWKKAIVTLLPGEKIELFEGV